MKSSNIKIKNSKKLLITWQKFRWFSGGFLFLVIGVIIWTASKQQISDFDLLLSGGLAILALIVTLFNRKLEKEFKTKVIN